jgi:type I restriction enzyme R subunit
LFGLVKPNIGPLSDEFPEDVRQMKSRNSAAESADRLLRDEITLAPGNNVVQERSTATARWRRQRQYHNRAIETARNQ